jgi:16S rRNA (guanine527-N7)-methyltransferase
MNVELSPVVRLAQAGAALGLGLAPDTIDKLLGYLRLLQRWNGVYNLTAVRDFERMMVHHVFDCLAVVPPLRRHAAGRRLELLDAGSGAGLPGAVLAIAEPDWSVTCAEAVAKKAHFVRQVAVELALANLASLHGRVEDQAAEQTFGVVISRAFASLHDFVQATRNRLAPQSVWVAMKGKTPVDELATLPLDVVAFHVEHIQVPALDAERCLVWMRLA